MVLRLHLDDPNDLSYFGRAKREQIQLIAENVLDRQTPFYRVQYNRTQFTRLLVNTASALYTGFYQVVPYNRLE